VVELCVSGRGLHCFPVLRPALKKNMDHLKVRQNISCFDYFFITSASRRGKIWISDLNSFTRKVRGKHFHSYFPTQDFHFSNIHINKKKQPLYSSRYSCDFGPYFSLFSEILSVSNCRKIFVVNQIIHLVVFNNINQNIKLILQVKQHCCCAFDSAWRSDPDFFLSPVRATKK